ncbi:MAG: nitroreductase family deazaflavin-dependent oxidoreductase [Anaerolineae bacterium]|nr:nitroreductase family deazaflavin-dependent oxidoreductase [Anaerolineae bacterium]
MTLTPQQEAAMRHYFKYLNRFMVIMWRLGLGRLLNAWPERGGQIMVIVHTGRKSGQTRYAPVNYALVDGELYCSAGFGAKTHWYKNIMAIPAVEVWLPDGRWTGVAEDVSDHADRLRLMRAVMIGSGFAAPLLANIHPHTMSDDALHELTATYRLIHITRDHKRHTPGDLAWVLWGLLALFLITRRKR